MLKILIIEDHALVREGLVRLLARIESGVVLRDCADFDSALAVLEGEDEVDLVLLDLALPGIDGFVGLDILRREFPALPVVVVSAFDDAPTINRVMNLGASGFIPKAFSGEALLAALHEVLAGNIFRPDGAGKAARLDDMPSLPPAGKGVQPSEVGLTERQGQVLALMVRGLSNREIGDYLELSEGTVKIHVTAIFKALGVGSRTQAMVAVARYGIDFGKVL
ncbi:MAG: response regulator transcription factor [Azonexus sp.]|jgi:DNA-binding NarL/FixJ family response regulator